MQRTLLASTLACLVLVPATIAASAAERAAVNRRTGLFEPPIADLRKAAERGDRAELTRAAGRLGPARLGKALADPDRRTVLAALEGIPLVPGGVLLFDQVAPLAGSTEVVLRERAIRTLAALLGGNEADRLAEWEVPAESTRAACQALAAAAANENELPALRLAAVQGLADAGATCAASFTPAKLLSSRDPEVRRAAVLALPLSPETKGHLLAAAKDSDLRVAAAAGARLCSLHTKSHTPLPQVGLSRLVIAGSAAIEDVIEMLPCLASSKDAEDGKALETLRASGPAAVRDAIKSLASPSKGGT
jgi:hypothetical protein